MSELVICGRYYLKECTIREEAELYVADYRLKESLYYVCGVETC